MYLQTYLPLCQTCKLFRCCIFVLFFISTTFSLCPPLVVCIHTLINVVRWDYFPCLSRLMSPSISCSNPKTCLNCNLQDELCNHWEFLFCWLTRVASGERCLKQLWPPRTQTQHLFSCTLCCSGLPHHAVPCWVLTTLVGVHRSVLLPRHSCVAHSQCCCVAYCNTKMCKATTLVLPTTKSSCFRVLAQGHGSADRWFLLHLFKYLFLQKSEDNCEKRTHFWFSRHCYDCFWQDKAWEHPSHRCVRSGKKR